MFEKWKNSFRFLPFVDLLIARRYVSSRGRLSARRDRREEGREDLPMIVSFGTMNDIFCRTISRAIKKRILWRSLELSRIEC